MASQLFFTQASEERLVMATITRVVASFSATATLMIMLCFLCFKELRTLPNTIIFLASPANFIANAAQFIATDGLSNPSGAACQFQAFLLEWFVQADPWWSCAASISVFLIFFKKFDGPRIKRLHPWYILICYGITFGGALGSYFAHTYGGATLWCWIDQKDAMARIYAFYGPVWVSIIVAISLYVAVGVRVFRTRAQLREAGNPYHNALATRSSPTVSSRTPTLDRERTDNWTGSPSLRVPEPMHPPSPSLPDLETATSMGSSQTPFRPYPQQRVHSLSAFMTNILSLFSLSGIRSAIRSAIGKLDPVMYKYTKSGSLFLASVLITWVPPSINRVYSIVRPEGSLTYALNVATAVVLPSQGLWNAIVFFSINLPACKRIFRDIRSGRRIRFVGRIFGWQRVGSNIPLVDRRQAHNLM